MFFAVVGKPPAQVTAADVLGFVTAQHTGAALGRVQLAGLDAGGVSARTVRRRLSSVSGLFGLLHARGDVQANPVPRGLPTRRERQRPRQGVPLVRTPRTLPRILSLRGGYGAQRIVDGVDFDAVRDDPKLFMGFSDITALHVAPWCEARLATVHGPTAAYLDTGSGSSTASGIQRALMTSDPVTMTPDETEETFDVRVAGRAQGVLLGGNLTMLATTAGTRHRPDLSGTILMIEAVNEEPYRVDRSLVQLRRAGWLDASRVSRSASSPTAPMMVRLRRCSRCSWSSSVHSVSRFSAACHSPRRSADPIGPRRTCRARRRLGNTHRSAGRPVNAPDSPRGSTHSSSRVAARGRVMCRQRRRTPRCGPVRPVAQNRHADCVRRTVCGLDAVRHPTNLTVVKVKRDRLEGAEVGKIDVDRVALVL